MLAYNCLYFILHLKILFGCLEGIRLLLQRIIISGWKFYVQFLLLLNKQWYDLLIVRSMASLLLCDIISIRMHQLVFRERWFFYFFILPLLYKIDLYLIQPVHVLDDLMKVCERAPGESDIGRNLKECIIRHNLIELTHREWFFVFKYLYN